MQRRSIFLLLILAFAYACTKWAKHHFQLHPFFRDHFTDLLFIPMQLTLALTAVRFLKRDQTIRIPILQVIATVIAMIALFEWYLPNYGKDRQQHTGDLIDAAMYVLGGAFFLLCQQQILTKREANLREK
jgi:peptidoglycan/LPS O-acetylase OafA/YrhL